MRRSRCYRVTGNNGARVTAGEPDCCDDTPAPDPALGKALFALADRADQESLETGQDAGIGARRWARAGRPAGTS